MQGEFNLQDVVDSYVKEGFKAFTETERYDIENKFCVSDAGKCHLMRYWKRQGTPFSDPEKKTKNYCEFLANAINHAGMHVYRNYPVENEHLKGYIDLIVDVNGRRILYVVKPIEEVLECKNHFMEAYTYALLDTIHDFHDVRVAYVKEGEDKIKITEKSLNLNDIARAVFEDWLKLIEAWGRRKEPKRWYSIECDTCVYSFYCASDREIMREEIETEEEGQKELIEAMKWR